MSKESFSFNKEIDLPKDLKIGIAKAKWNSSLVAKIFNDAVSHLKNMGVDDLATIEVPGSWELVHASNSLIQECDGVLAIGVIIKGETIHYELISKAVAAGLVEVIVNSKKPIALGIISAETKDQAIARSSSKGKEFAQSLLESLAR